MDSMIVAAMLVPSLFDFYVTTGQKDDFRVYQRGSTVYIDCNDKLPAFVVEDCTISLCGWKLDLANPDFEALIIDRMEECTKNGLECDCKYFLGDHDK